MVLNNPLFVARNSRSGYQIEQSLRFNNESENVYLSKTFGSDGNRKKWTWSAWIKLGRVSDEGHVFEAYTGSGDNELFMRFNSNDSIRFGQFTSTAYDWKLDTTAKYRDPSAWYHVILVFDSDNATSSDRARIYVNGERVTAFDSPTYPASGANGYVNKSGYPHYLCNSGLTTRDFGGYLAEVNFIDGVAVTDALDFGEYDENNVWIPKRYSGSYGTNGFFLNFSNSSSLGEDQAGSNDWTSSGLAATDVVLDTPTNNFATYNPLSKSNFATITLSEGNLKSVNSSNTSVASSLGTIFVNSGKWYCEFRSNAVGDEDAIGIFTEHFNTSSTSFYNGEFLALLGGGLYYSTYSSYAGSDFGSGDIVRMKLDLDNQTVGWAINGGSFNDVNLSSYDSHSAGEYWTFGVRNGSSGGDGTHNISVNFGQDSSFAGSVTRQNNSDDNNIGDFYYSPPTGFLALCTANLPAPDIADGSQNMQTVLWTGTGSSRTQGGYNFQPDLLWIMNRSNTGMNVRLHDVVRGDNGTVMYRLGTNHTNGQDTDTDVTGLTSTGFTIGNDGTDHPNVSGHSYVGWGWKAGQNSGSSNTDGTITSTVSASPSSGFSIGTFTGTGAVGSIGHGLGVAPKFILIKRTNVSGNSWAVYHDSLGVNKQLLLNSTNAASGDSNGFPSAPTSTVINVGTGAQMDTNQSGAHVFYAWAEIEGYIKIGSYEGNGSSDGPFVYCGFKPAWVIMKAVDNAGKWTIQDTTRNPYNRQDNVLCAEDTRSEAGLASSGVTGYIDALSNGFKIRDSWSDYNTNGSTNIFIAFASNPFGGDGVSPATAR